MLEYANTYKEDKPFNEIILPILYAAKRNPKNINPTDFLDLLKEDNSCNCELYVAGVQRAFGIYIPDYFRSSDFAKDTTYTKSIDYRNEQIQTGDIIGFWRKGETDTKRIHLGILRWDQEEHIVKVVHASKEKGHVVVSHIGELLLDPKYAEIAFVKRGTNYKHELYQQEKLLALGLNNNTYLRRAA